MFSRRSFFAAAFVAFVTATAAIGAAQSSTRCAISGSVQDESRSPLAGVSVEAVSDVNGDQPRTASTTADGTFSFSDLPSGTYTVTLHMPEFQTFKREGIYLRPGMRMSMTAVLRADRIRD